MRSRIVNQRWTNLHGASDLGEGEAWRGRFKLCLSLIDLNGVGISKFPETVMFSLSLPNHDPHPAGPAQDTQL